MCVRVVCVIIVCVLSPPSASILLPASGPHGSAYGCIRASGTFSGLLRVHRHARLLQGTGFASVFCVLCVLWFLICVLCPDDSGS